MTECVVAIDLGGTKLASAVVDTTGRVFHRKKTGVRRENAGTCINQIEEAVMETIGNARLGEQEIRAASIVVPGIYFAATGHVWAPNVWGDEQIPLRAELERRLRLPVMIDSDRAGYVAGEQWLGAAKGLRDVVFLSIGTGIGAGIIAGGQLLRGTGDIAGAVGWFALNPNLREIYRKIGCWEAEAAGPALARRIDAPSAEDVIAAARNSDAAAKAAIEDAARYLGMGIANIISLLNPQMVVLGGGLMQSADLFLDSVKRVMLEWAQPLAAQQVRIAVTELGQDAGLLGAARIAFNQLSM